MTLRSVSYISCVTQHDTADLCAGKKKGSVKEVAEVLGARSLLSLTDRRTGFHARFCAAEFFTLGLTSGMCEWRVVL